MRTSARSPSARRGNRNRGSATPTALGDNESDVPDAVAALCSRSDKKRLQRLATEPRRLASLRRANDWAGFDHRS